MRAYVATSGAVFALIVLGHILRVFAEGPHLARDPGFILTTVLAVALCAWAFRVFRVSARS